jgi:hypothetical protein
MEKRVTNMWCFRINDVNRVTRGLAVGFGLLLAAACGSRSTDKLGGETGFLASCSRDAECQSGLCACGVCTQTCTDTAQCNDTRAVCAGSVSGKMCAQDGQDVCVLSADGTEPRTSNTTSTAGICRGPGHYEAGKEGSYLPCCDGLREVAQLSPTRDDGNAPICNDGAPLRVYACVQGSCGDGVCEVGEDVACGCVDDCPNAFWEPPTPVPTVPTDGGAPADTCEGFTCDVALRSESAGTVEMQVELSGPFCSASCGLHQPTVYHLDTGHYVPVGQGLDCAECRELAGTGECAPPVVMGRAWNGSVNHSDSTCTTDTQRDVACQSEARYAPPGRYRAEICSLVATTIAGTAQCQETDEVRCVSMEFDYPSSEPVVLRLDSAAGDADGGLQSNAESDASVL